MQTFIHEIGVVDKTGKTHSVRFKQGLNIVTGKSSTGKSALIEIFDYCFGSKEYTVPEGVITDHTAIYYVYLWIDGQNIVIARMPENEKKGFFKREECYSPEKISRDYFISSHFLPLEDFKKHLRGLFLDIDDIDESLIARENRKYGAKAPTPSIRSFMSFMLQHQNLVANKHALFYRFDEKAKRDQVVSHSKIFLGLVDQEFFHLSQEKERLTGELASLKREEQTNKKVADNHRQQVAPILRQLYSSMGFSKDPVTVQSVLLHTQDAKRILNEVVRPEGISPLSSELSDQYQRLQADLASKTSQLRRLQRKASSIRLHISKEERFVENGSKLLERESVNYARSVCPFCHAEHDQLQTSAAQLGNALSKLCNDLKQANPMRAKFESSLVETGREIENLANEITIVTNQINEIEKSEKELAERKNLFESILMIKARLFVLLDSLAFSNDSELEARLKATKSALNAVEKKLKEYDYSKGIAEANSKVSEYMAEIGKYFDFEEGYRPINLQFSFESFDLYHETPKGKKIFLRSMGSGANWLYCHVTLFLAIHKYFASLGSKCAIPSVLFFDQPTQVYFPNFKQDKSEIFDIHSLDKRDENEENIDDDLKAVENLFSQLSIYCTKAVKEFGFSPQIIVTDHADDLTLSDGALFDDFVNGNRWRTRGFINLTEDEEEA